MTQKGRSCAACGTMETNGAGISHAIVEGRSLWLCLDHATAVAVAMPETFEDLRSIFVQAEAGESALVRFDSATNRRSPKERRLVDRRVFPPRPEGRRMGTGRRAGEPID